MRTIEEILAKNFQGVGKKLDNIDIPKIAYENGFSEDAVHAVMEVESRGSGFDDYGRPKILFEPHYFYKLLGDTPTRKQAVSQGIAYAKWGTKKYPSDSYPNLAKAIKIHPEKALRSASWGMMQVMGDNYKMLNYTNVFDMVWNFMEDEEHHLRGGIDFIIAANLSSAIKSLNWEKFAAGYNGPGYAKNKYPQKLKAAYTKWKKIPDVPYENFRDYLVEKNDTGDPNAAVTIKVDDNVEDSVIDAVVDEFVAPTPIKPLKKGQYGEEGLSPPQIEYIQTRLRNLGYLMVGKIDGKWMKGGSVTAAICALQEKCDITVDGHYGPEVRAALAITDGSNRYEVSEARKNTTVKDLRMAGSRTIKATDASKATSLIAGSGLGLLSAGSAVVDYAPQALSWISPIKDFFGDVPVWIWAIVGIVVCVVLYFQAKNAEKARLDDEQTGAHTGLPDPSPSPPVTVVSSKSAFALKPFNKQPEQDKVLTE
jgi:hypothetical protein